jgi:hypothetical protein
MAHFAKIENGLVSQVVVAEESFISTGALGDPASWVQTSYNTRGGIHYGQDGQPSGREPLRGNYAGIGYTYDQTNDVFYAPQPYPSWTLNNQTWLWESPVPYPQGDKLYSWDEATTSWIEVENGN